MRVLYGRNGDTASGSWPNAVSKHHQLLGAWSCLMPFLRSIIATFKASPDIGLEAMDQFGAALVAEACGDVSRPTGARSSRAQTFMGIQWCKCDCVLSTTQGRFMCW